jgi:alpha-amylase
MWPPPLKFEEVPSLPFRTLFQTVIIFFPMNYQRLILCCLVFGWAGFQQQSSQELPQVTNAAVESAVSPFWKNATVYFLLTDRFYNGNSGNDFQYNRRRDGAFLRNFLGGDLQGITQKIEAGYFDSLGVNAIWMTPVVEQIHGSVDEGTGKTYGYHGYWTRDWTCLDPNFGTADDLRDLVETAHDHGIRILMDAVINHTGPVTPIDAQWPEAWVRTGPTCKFTGYESTVACTLVENLPDIRTERKEPVALPAFFEAKWEAEGRLEEETQELEAFFERTGYPRAPRYYLIKWLTDWVREYGIDGYRVDTAKHLEAEVLAELKKEAEAALKEWKNKFPERKIDDSDFYMVGEVYGYGIDGQRIFDYGDREVDFFDYGMESLINFSFKADAQNEIGTLFQKYSSLLNEASMQDVSVLNYVSSHDDGNPFDPDRAKALETGTKLLLSPGAVQIYYGDETARALSIPGAKGDANLRSLMNWEDIENNTVHNGHPTLDVLDHWRKLGRFRNEHLSVGAGQHEALSEAPYIFRRTLDSDGVSDAVLVAIDVASGRKTIPVYKTFPDGTVLKDYYSGRQVTVSNGQVVMESPFTMVLLGKNR